MDCARDGTCGVVGNGKIGVTAAKTEVTGDEDIAGIGEARIGIIVESTGGSAMIAGWDKEDIACTAIDARTDGVLGNGVEIIRGNAGVVVVGTCAIPTEDTTGIIGAKMGRRVDKSGAIGSSGWDIGAIGAGVEDAGVDARAVGIRDDEVDVGTALSICTTGDEDKIGTTEEITGTTEDTNGIAEDTTGTTEDTTGTTADVDTTSLGDVADTTAD